MIYFIRWMDFIDWNPKTSLKIYIKKGMVENHQSMIKKTASAFRSQFGMSIKSIEC